MTMSIVFAGTPDNAATTLKELHRAGVPIALVVTRVDAPVGRKRVLTPSPVAAVASELRLPTLKTNRLDSEALSVISASRAEFGVVVAYGALLKADALAALPKGWFNLHYSLLPALRGAAPVQQAIRNGYNESGVTLFKIDEGLDTGDIVAQLPIAIERDDNAGELLERMTFLGTSLLIQEIPRIASGLVDLKRQSEDGASRAPKPTRQDALIEVTDSPNVAEAKVRAFNPEPGAWLKLNGEPFKVLTARSNSQAVEVFDCILADKRVLLGLSGGSLELLTVQPAGKSAMNAADWFRGAASTFKGFDR